MAKKLLIKNDKLVVSGGKLVITEDALACGCCENCAGTSFSEPFNTTIPGNWSLDYAGSIPTVVSGGLEKLVSGVGAGMEVGPCIAPAVFSDTFTMSMETQISSDAGPFTTDSDCGLKFTADDGFTLRFYRSRYSLNFEELNFSYRLGGGSTVLAYNVGGAFGTILANGDVLRMEVDVAAGDVEEVRAYFNGVLVHTETFVPAETLGNLALTDPYALLEVLVFTSSSHTERFEYFNVTL